MKTRSIPHSNIAEEAGLRLNPCMDAHTLYGKDVDEGTLQKFIAAKNNMPSGACSNPQLAEKIFTVHFLRYALIALVNDPWEFEKKIAAQEYAINNCRDIHCFENELDMAIAALTPLYLNVPDQKWPDGLLCNTESSEILPSALTNEEYEKITNECGGIGPENVTISTCNDSHGKLVSARCTMQGNQVNASEWLFREKETEKELLLYTDNGPLGALKTTCNDMPDLLTVARINADTHFYVFYRFDGRRYQSVYDYTSMSIDNGDFHIA